MAKVLRPVSHEARLSIVDHLDELRSRLFVCLIALGIAFGICFWQNQALLSVLNKPLPKSVTNEANHLSGLTSDSVKASHELSKAASQFGALAGLSNMTAQERAVLDSIQADPKSTADALPRTLPKNVPITIGVGEPFTTTLTVCVYFALLIHAAGAALRGVRVRDPGADRQGATDRAADHDRRAGAVHRSASLFTYFVVLPAAIHFLQGYNSQYFNIARPGKAAVPVRDADDGGHRARVPAAARAARAAPARRHQRQHSDQNWRYATVIIAIIAAAMPGCGSGHDRAGDATAGDPVPGEYRDAQDCRPS